MQNMKTFYVNAWHWAEKSPRPFKCTINAWPLCFQESLCFFGWLHKTVVKSPHRLLPKPHPPPLPTLHTHENFQGTAYNTLVPILPGNFYMSPTVNAQLLESIQGVRVLILLIDCLIKFQTLLFRAFFLLHQSQVTAVIRQAHSAVYREITISTLMQSQPHLQC